MIEIQNKINHIEANQKDQAKQMLEIKRLVNSLNIKTAFINLSNEGFLCYYIIFNLDKVCLNSTEIKHFEEYNKIPNVKIINHPYLKVMIRKYDLIHISLNPIFEDLTSYIGRIESCANKCIVTSHTTNNENDSKVIEEYLTSRGWEISYLDKQYYGINIYKKLKQWKN